MAFLLRTISHSAEGREIVRTSRIEGDQLTIGRGPDCDVHLTDLAVALRHATVERLRGHLEVRVEEGLSIELNGRKVSAGTIEPMAGGDILIASHVLRFMPTPPQAEEIAVNVERVTESEVKLDRQLAAAAQPLGHEEARIVQLSLDDNAFAGGLYRRLSGRYQSCRTAGALAETRRRLAAAVGDRALALESVAALLERKAAALARIRKHLRIKALIEIWLWVHVPFTFALIAALAAHIVSVFFYW